MPESIGNLKELRSLSLQECPLVFSPKKCPQDIISFLPSLMKLDLGYCNIMDDMIPHDLGGLCLLNELKLCGNSFTNFPVGMSKLPNLQIIWLDECKWLQSIPQLQSSLLSLHAKDCPSLVSINLANFHYELDLEVSGCPNLKEVDGFFNLETLSVDTLEKLLKDKVSFTQESLAGIHVRVINNVTETYVTNPLQTLSERGVYSIFLPRYEIPRWFSHQKEDDTVSFYVPQLQDTKLVGFATCAIYAWRKPHKACLFFPPITITNMTKRFNWFYAPYVTFFCNQVVQDIMWLCYWMFDNQSDDGVDSSWRFKDEIEEGDEVEFAVDMGFGITIKKCAIHPLYQQPSQPNDLALVSSATSRHDKRPSQSHPKRLTFECHEKIKADRNSTFQEFIIQEDEEFLEWEKQRTRKMTWTLDDGTSKPTSKKSTKLEDVPAESSSNVESNSNIEKEYILTASPEIISKIRASQETFSESNMTESTSNAALFASDRTGSTTSEPTIPNVHIKSKNLLSELSKRLKRSQLSGENSSSSNSSPNVRYDFIQQQRKSLADFLNMSIEGIQKANAFEDIKKIAHTLIQCIDNSMERAVVENLIVRMDEFKYSIPSAMAMAEATRTHMESLQERTKHVDAKLRKMQDHLSSLEAEFSKLSEEEMQVEAEIQRLTLRKIELHSLRDSVALELEKNSEETSKDLNEWENLDAESKHADHTWLQANQKLADANTFFKLVKEKLML